MVGRYEYPDSSSFRSSFEGMLKAEKLITKCRMVLEYARGEKDVDNFERKLRYAIVIFEEGRRHLRYLRCSEAIPFFSVVQISLKNLLIEIDQAPYLPTHPKDNPFSLNIVKKKRKCPFPDVEIVEAPAEKGWWNLDGEQLWSVRIPVVVQEIGGIGRENVPIILRLGEILDYEKFNWSSLRIINAAEKAQEEIPYQIDVEEEGKYAETAELVFQVSLKAGEKLLLYFYFSDEEVPKSDYSSDIAVTGLHLLSNSLLSWNLLDGKDGLIIKNKGKFAGERDSYLKFLLIANGKSRKPEKISVQKVYSGAVRGSVILKGEFGDFDTFLKIQIFSKSRIVRNDFWSSKTVERNKLILA